MCVFIPVDGYDTVDVRRQRQPHRPLGSDGRPRMRPDGQEPGELRPNYMEQSGITMPGYKIHKTTPVTPLSLNHVARRARHIPLSLYSSLTSSHMFRNNDGVKGFGKLGRICILASIILVTYGGGS